MYIILILVVVLVVFLVAKARTDNAKNDPVPVVNTISHAVESDENVVAPTIFSDEKGRDTLETKKRQVPRQLYILGQLKGKYWGEFNEDVQSSDYFKLYDFQIYEAEVFFEAKQSTPFSLPDDSMLPKHKIPGSLPIILIHEDEAYEVKLHEPKVSGVNFNRKLHQTDGKESFGTVQCQVTGYLLDFVEEQYEEKKYLSNDRHSALVAAGNSNVETLSSLGRTQIETGKVKYSGAYLAREMYMSDYKTTYYGPWEINPAQKSTGAAQNVFSTIAGLFSLAMMVIFLILLIPHLVYLLPFILIWALIRLLPLRIWEIGLKIVSAILIGIFLVAMIRFVLGTYSRHTYVPIPRSTAESIPTEYQPLHDSAASDSELDTLITHKQEWIDYAGNKYEGKFSVRTSALSSARSFKNSLPEIDQPGINYDKTVFKLKEHDKNALGGLYKMFDSIQTLRNLSESQFAEMVVSFVQAIPYSLVLQSACDSKAYADDFIKSYLTSPNAICDPNEKFGVNTPVEFLASLKGDCDTRTLLLYTVFSHYHYDVILLSSESYAHSLIGLNLPYAGTTYPFQSHRYVLWETTSPGFAPGIIPGEISQLNNWRVSLKAKS
jgi:hypothetical protein